MSDKWKRIGVRLTPEQDEWLADLESHTGQIKSALVKLGLTLAAACVGVGPMPPSNPPGRPPQEGPETVDNEALARAHLALRLILLRSGYTSETRTVQYLETLVNGGEPDFDIVQSVLPGITGFVVNDTIGDR